jgi:hypothetical protein
VIAFYMPASAFVVPPIYHAFGLLALCVGLTAAFPEFRTTRVRLALGAVILAILGSQFGHAMAWNSNICAGVTGIMYYVGGCWAY